MNCCELMDASVYLTKEVGNPFEAYPNKIDYFTKSELAEIMGGAIYKVKQKSKSVTIDELIADGWNRLIGNNWEWINPLIELVPVEDGE
ncbi:hypothetical protein [Lactococcus lactis]|uniref:hypothetical protein n=1 Tax=Lactococcus lactis TaxID=1358 RepID=UPI002891FE3E|nr:hypothetical protein [Lactococcus lactis]MDT2857967.1 hypothetical protein [Lactococcus lactis]